MDKHEGFIDPWKRLNEALAREQLKQAPAGRQVTAPEPDVNSSLRRHA